MLQVYNRLIKIFRKIGSGLHLNSYNSRGLYLKINESKVLKKKNKKEKKLNETLSSRPFTTEDKIKYKNKI